MLKQVIWHEHDCRCRVCEPPQVVFQPTIAITRESIGDLGVTEHYRKPKPDEK